MEATKQTYKTLETFFAALTSGEINKDDVEMHFDCDVFYACDIERYHEYISGEWEDVYDYFKVILRTKNIPVIDECEG